MQTSLPLHMLCTNHISLLLKSEKTSIQSEWMQKTSAVPVNSLNKDEDLLPGPVCSRLAMHNSIPEQLLQTLHI